MTTPATPAETAAQAAITSAEGSINAVIEGILLKYGVPTAIVGPILTDIEAALPQVSAVELQDLQAKLAPAIWRAVSQKEGQEFSWMRPIVDPTLERFVEQLTGMPKPTS